MGSRHGKACAERWRKQGAVAGWPLEQVARGIHGCCEVTLLRAHRLARAWTLAEAVRHFVDMCERADVPRIPRLDPDQLRVWETNSVRRPLRSTADLLCRLYESSPAALGLETAGDYSVSPTALTAFTSVHCSVPAPAGTEQCLDEVRTCVDRTLASATVTSAQLDALDERLLDHRRRYITSSPREMLTDLVADLREIQALSNERQPASAQLRLSEMTAILATLVADALMKLGELRQATAWYATARTAADDCGHRELRARVRVQAAMLPYYYGPLESAIRLAHEARLLSQHRPTSTGAFAAAAEARARARAGDRKGAEHALSTAENLFDRASPAAAEDAWSFPERRMLLYISGTLTYLGETAKACAVQRHAHSLYTRCPGSIAPALLRLDEAICLVQEQRPEEACEVAVDAYVQVSEDRRSQILGNRTRNVIEALPPRLRTMKPARTVTEVLALPPSPA